MMCKIVDEKWNEFVKQTDYREVKHYKNGFMGFGILKKPEDHLDRKGENTILFMSCTFYNNDIISFSRIAVRLDEAKDMLKNLGLVIKEIDNRKKDSENK